MRRFLLMRASMRAVSVSRKSAIARCSPGRTTGTSEIEECSASDREDWDRDEICELRFRSIVESQ